MNEFSGFSKAARLYAQNLPVVQAMQKLMEAELQQFRDSLREEVKRLVAPLHLMDGVSRESDGDWHGWLVARLEQEAKVAWKEMTLPWVVFDESPVALILGREVVCNVPGSGYLKVEEKEMLRIADLAEDPELQAQGVQRSPQGWVLLTVRVVYEDRNPVEKLAPVLAVLLRKLDQIRGSASATRRKRPPARPREPG